MSSIRKNVCVLAVVAGLFACKVREPTHRPLAGACDAMDAEKMTKILADFLNGGRVREYVYCPTR